MRNKDLRNRYCLNSLVFKGAIAVLVIASLLSQARASEPIIDTSKAVIHHSASPDMSAKVIDKYHKSKGWKCIGYHFVIRTNGDIEKGRPLTMKGAHAKGRNNYIGICLTGYDHFTKAQIKSLCFLLNKLGVSHIERHHEKCPGNGLDMQYVRNNLVKKEIVLVGRAK